MESDIFEQIRNNLEQIENKEELHLKKIKTKEIKNEDKRKAKIRKGTQKVYYEIWKQILKNVKKECFNIYISITYDGERNFFVSKITVDNHIKKISKIPVDSGYLQHLLNNDGLNLYTLKNGKIYGNKSLFVVPVVRFELKYIVDQENKQKNYNMKFCI